MGSNDSLFYPLVHISTGLNAMILLSESLMLRFDDGNPKCILLIKTGASNKNPTSLYYTHLKIIVSAGLYLRSRYQCLTPILVKSMVKPLSKPSPKTKPLLTMIIFTFWSACPFLA